MLLKKNLGQANSLEDADIILMCDYLATDSNALNRANYPIEKRILLILEPQVVLPTNFKKHVLRDFGTVVRVGRPDESQSLKLNWPQHWREVTPQGSNRNNQNAVMIFGNKLSFVHGELYSLRRKAAFELPNVEIFGSDWNSTTGVRFRKLLIEALNALKAGQLPQINSLRYWFRSNAKWLGSPENKNAVLEKYKVSLVIENSREFLTEKLFDSFFAGCIPVYVGPDVEKYGIPSSLVVSASANISSIREGIEIAQKMDYSAWHEELVTWLTKEETNSDWSTESFFTKLSELILSCALRNT